MGIVKGSWGEAKANIKTLTGKASSENGMQQAELTHPKETS